MKKSQAIAVAFTSLIVIWMCMGMLFKGSEERGANNTYEEKTNQNIVVETRQQSAQPIVSYIIAQGHITPDRAVTLRAKEAAQVHQVLIKEGERVKEGDILAKLDIDDRNIKLEKAEAKRVEALRKYNSAKNLSQKGYTARANVDEALAILKAAEAEEKQMSLQVANTEIDAPFDGIIDSQHIEKGDYVSVGSEVFVIVDNDPLIVTVYVPQNEISAIQKGGLASISMATGQNKKGVIRFIAPRAEEITRTFRVEIAIPNTENLPSGTSATARIPKETVMAHFVSPSLLTLDDKGNTGVKVIGKDEKVEFYTTKIISAEPSGVYVIGLPETARVITNGQGFVSSGEHVEFVEVSNDNH